jgi:MEMO1 family protein
MTVKIWLGLVLLTIFTSITVWAKFTVLNRRVSNETPLLQELTISPRGLLIPHHLIATDKVINPALSTLKSLQPTPAYIILLTPNHNEQGGYPMITSNTWLSQSIEINSCYQNLIAAKSLANIPKIVDQEHAIFGTLPLIFNHYPSVPVIPLMLSARLAEVDQTLLAQKLAQCPGLWVAIASVDFSHYLNTAAADLKDAATWPVIINRDYATLAQFGNDHLDAPQVMSVFEKTLDAVGASQIKQLSHHNSGNILGNRNTATTSYFSALWY